MVEWGEACEGSGYFEGYGNEVPRQKALCSLLV